VVALQLENSKIYVHHSYTKFPYYCKQNKLLAYCYSDSSDCWSQCIVVSIFPEHEPPSWSGHVPIQHAQEGDTLTTYHSSVSLEMCMPRVWKNDAANDTTNAERYPVQFLSRAWHCSPLKPLGNMQISAATCRHQSVIKNNTDQFFTLQQIWEILGECQRYPRMFCCPRENILPGPSRRAWRSTVSMAACCRLLSHCIHA